MNNTKVWHGFSLDDLFIICRGNAKNINSKKDEGDVSLISAKDNNNGFNKNVIPTSKETIYKNVYTVNNNGNGVCLSYYHEYPLIASSDVTILKPKYDKFCNISVALFITTLIRQQKSKFNYGYKMSESRVKKQKILLPLKQGFDESNNSPTIEDIDFEYMIKNKGIIFSRDYLLNEIWGFDFEGDDRVVDTLVKRIRKKLGDYSFLLKTIRGMGYSFDENKN